MSDPILWHTISWRVERFAPPLEQQSGEWHPYGLPCLTHLADARALFEKIRAANPGVAFRLIQTSTTEEVIA